MSEETKEIPKKDEDIKLLQLITEGGNPRGIPSAKFIENVEEYLSGNSVESTLGALQELYSKYKYMEQSFEKSKNVYKSKLPVIEQTIDLIKTLKQKKEDDEEVVTHYSLCDTLYASAKIDTSDSKICLWVGASTMVEYSYDEGLELLGNQLTQSHEKIQELNEDLEHLRSNSIIVEVNMARLFNHNVKMKKLLNSGNGGDNESKSG